MGVVGSLNLEIWAKTYRIFVGNVQDTNTQTITSASRKEVKTMEALIDTLLYLVIIGAVVIIIGGLLYGIIRMIHKIRGINAAEQDIQDRINNNRDYMRKEMSRHV